MSSYLFFALPTLYNSTCLNAAYVAILFCVWFIVCLRYFPTKKYFSKIGVWSLSVSIYLVDTNFHFSILSITERKTVFSRLFIYLWEIIFVIDSFTISLHVTFQLLCWGKWCNLFYWFWRRFSLTSFCLRWIEQAIFVIDFFSIDKESREGDHLQLLRFTGNRWKIHLEFGKWV